MKRQQMVAAAGAAILALSLAACGDDNDSDTAPVEAPVNDTPTEDDTPAEDDTEPTEAPEGEPGDTGAATQDVEEETSEEMTDEPGQATETDDDADDDTRGDDNDSDDTSGDAASGDFTTPEWADPVSTDGELITSIDAGDLTIDVYQVGTGEATRDSNFVNPDNDEPIVAEGDELVFMNYVVRNTGEPVNLTFALITVNTSYDDWPYANSLIGNTDRDAYAEFGLNTTATVTGTDLDTTHFVLEPGQWFALGDDFLYQPGSPIEFTVRYTLTDDEGETLEDGTVQAEGDGVII